MKKVFLLLLVLVTTVIAQAQTWIGYTTTTVNLREGPSTDYNIVKKLPEGSVVYIDTDEEKNGFYLAVDIENDIEGYVSKKFIKHYKDVAKSEGSSIQSDGQTDSYEPTIKISNNTSTNLTLRVNSITYRFKPFESREITINPGKFSYRASSPGVLPSSGYHTAESYSSYTWDFSIVTSRK